MNTIQETLAAVEAGSVKKNAAIAKERRSFVEKVAKGSAVPAELLVAKLTEWGCTATTFRAEVEALAHRLNLKAEADQLADRQSRLAVLQKEVAVARQEHAAAVAAADAKLNAALGELAPIETELMAGIRRSEDSATRLYQTCPYVELHEQRNAAQVRLNAAQSRLAALRENVQTARGKQLPTAESDLLWQKGTAGAGTLLEPMAIAHAEKDKADRVKRAADRVADIKAEIVRHETASIPDAERELAEAQAAFDEVQAAFSEP
ncbi:MAG: hypothetical protein C0467_07065 [Planctomycetaceae bacterium]|nr:hypothetical protein [Planctomycetaceae bacterium]